MADEIRALIVSSRTLSRACLRTLMAQAGLTVIGEAGDYEGARELVERERPEVIVTDSSAFWSDEILTGREREVARLAAQGFKNQAIAEQLCIAEATVRHHLTTIYQKLGVAGQLDLVIYAQQHGW